MVGSKANLARLRAQAPAPRYELSHAEIAARLNAIIAPSRADTQKMVRDTAALMGVNPRLAMAHAYIESGFNSRALSPAGAAGVMQLIPAASRWAGRMVGRDLDWLIPADNITAGIAIIRYLQRHTTSTHEAIAAYYQGLARLREAGPYPSTQKYVLRVLRAAKSF
ncbi:lytic transglycosylase domain-containing protein [Actinotignum sanguinis]|uniref:lytic transglycosylase domain-containing protein n=1 Tax=Actinotignum sanguinis TaxID=1445614 RepID=UPI000F7F39BC|nr:lytic transglycosylase domain-containing protein [Actinotignum sanguinis]MDY5148456.1 lytic transglycosylase domain-containing protein [Actinotignum sanguinis]RTE51205.1 lytic transglycosylase domain-containing protein [Actinotignum sanguinis]